MSDTKRGRIPGWVLVVAFVVVPLVEIYVIIQIGQVIGPLWTILLLIADGILGAWLVKREGARAWQALRMALQEGRMPARELADGMLILVGGTLILTPGFVLDLIGLLCILPFTRPVGRRILSGVVSRKLVGVSFMTPGSSAGGPAQYRASHGGADRGRPDQNARPGERDDTVVEGEVVDDDPDQPR